MVVTHFVLNETFEHYFSVCDCLDVQSSTQQGATSSEGPHEVVKKVKLSLFDDEGDDDDDADLFAVSSSNTAKTTKPTAGDTSKVKAHTFTHTCCWFNCHVFFTGTPVSLVPMSYF